MYKLAVFDLDGTILDTLEDLTDAIKYTLDINGLPSRTREEVRSFVGNGVTNLIRRAAGENAKDYNKLVSDFRAYYKVHIADKTVPYAGIVETIAKLKALGVKTAVLSNKSHFATVMLTDKFFKDNFDYVAGEKEAEGIPKKPAPDALLSIMKAQGASASETVYIGDSEVDIQTAKNAGVDCISVCWGFKDEAFLKENGASIIVKKPAEILKFFTENAIGNTPLVRLKKIEQTYGLQAKLYAKVESENAGGSIKDRVAKAMIDEAEQSGRLKKGGIVIEPTSGNTGIGLALVASARGYKAVIVMPDTMSKERQTLIKNYGGEVVLTDGKKGMQGAVEKAEELLKTTPNAVIAGQFDNPANPLAHYQTTAPEIDSALNGEVDIFVAGVGTGGTLTGVGRYFKEKNKNIRICAVEPKSSPLLSQGRAGAHDIQGIGANFVPKNFDKTVCDEILTVTDESAVEYAKALQKIENLFVGISSGAALAGAIELAKRKENAGKNIVLVLPDSGDRYLSIL